MNLLKKIILTGQIKLETGLHIGGSKSSLDIGGLDSPVIKTPAGVPYIPGSSLKGKLRTLLGRKINGAEDEHKDDLKVKKLFGYHGRKEDKEKNKTKLDPVLSRLLIRDAHLDIEHFKKEFPEGEVVLETQYTQEKYENTIDRKTGKTKTGGLRNIERVPAGTKFNFEIVLDVYQEDQNDNLLDLLKQGISILNDDYLGGSGTRGYGKVKMAIQKEEPKNYHVNASSNS